VHGFVQDRFDVGPVGGGGAHSLEFAGDFFAELPAGFAPNHINGGPAGDLIEPRAEDGIGREAMRPAREVGESGVGDLLGELRGADLAERGGEDQIKVAADQSGKGIFGAVSGVARKQLQVRVAHLQEYIAAAINTGPKNCVRGARSPGRNPLTPSIRFRVIRSENEPRQRHETITVFPHCGPDHQHRARPEY
jgi:hypothetical protein